MCLQHSRRVHSLEVSRERKLGALRVGIRLKTIFYKHMDSLDFSSTNVISCYSKSQRIV